MMPVITLTSDFGTLDHRVAAIKGKIISLNTDANIVDITHEIQAYNLLQTAYIVRNAYHFFPKGTVHILAVDSFYHKERKLLLYKTDGHYFITSDNGLMSLIFFEIKPESVYEITLNNRFDDVVNFTPTDVFVPVAVHILNGGLPELIGRKIKQTKQLSFPKAGSKENLIFGEVIYIDHFGNIVSNISEKFFDKVSKKHRSFTIKFRNLALVQIYHSYTEIVADWNNETAYHGKPAAIFNDAGLLELTIYKGYKNNGAKTLFGLNVGEKIYIEFQ